VSDPAGHQKYWFNGLPVSGLGISGVDTGGLKYWFNGLPQAPASGSIYGIPPTPPPENSGAILLIGL
jgi:hypothetical protein